MNRFWLVPLAVVVSMGSAPRAVLGNEPSVAFGVVSGNRLFYCTRGAEPDGPVPVDSWIQLRTVRVDRDTAEWTARVLPVAHHFSLFPLRWRVVDDHLWLLTCQTFIPSQPQFYVYRLPWAGADTGQTATLPPEELYPRLITEQQRRRVGIVRPFVPLYAARRKDSFYFDLRVEPPGSIRCYAAVADALVTLHARHAPEPIPREAWKATERQRILNEPFWVFGNNGRESIVTASGRLLDATVDGKTVTSSDNRLGTRQEPLVAAVADAQTGRVHLFSRKSWIELGDRDQPAARRTPPGEGNDVAATLLSCARELWAKRGRRGR